MHGNEWRGFVYQPLRTGPAANGAHSSNERGHAFQAQEWLRIDEAGAVTPIRADRPRLAEKLKVPFRDLRMLDPSLPVPYPLSLFVRARAIIVNFEAIRLIICRDQAFVLSVPVPGETLLAGSPARRESPFVKHLVDCIRMHGSSDGSDSDGPARLLPFDAELPFELRCLEAALDAAIAVMAAETRGLEHNALPVINRVSHKVVKRSELEALRDLRSAMAKLTNRVSKLKQELETVLANEGEMRMMYLSRRDQDELQLAPGTAEPPQDVDDSDSEAKLSARQMWRHSVQLLHTVRSLHPSKLPEESGTWTCANLLDSNLMQVDQLVQRLEMLRDRIMSTEKFIDAELDHRRNQLVSLDIFVTAVMAMFAFVSMVGGIFGMNLTNGLESSHGMFLIATWGSLAVAAILFIGIMWFAWSKHLLLIPDKVPSGSS